MEPKEIGLKDLSGKVLVVDAFNQLYMFLSTIRGPDGTLLCDSNGHVTSHLVGIFSRFTRLMKENIKFVFVFDGVAPDEKRVEQQRRAKIKQEAEKRFAQAREQENVEEMKKYAARTSRLTKEMIEEAKQLIDALGIPIVQAPGEGEAQAAYMVKKGDAYAVMSQDADCLIFEAPRLVKNLTITGRRKQPGAYASRDLPPELIVLDENMKRLGLTQRQLITMALLTGTDYNYGGIKGIGPKKALALAQRFPGQDDAAPIFEEARWDDHFSVGWRRLFDLIEHPAVTDDYALRFKQIDEGALRRILVQDHDFSSDRIEKTLRELKDAMPKEHSLHQWFS